MPKTKIKEVGPVEKMRYFEGVGRRKSAIARVRLYHDRLKNKPESTDSNTKKTTDLDIIVNNRPISKYFSTEKDIKIAVSPLKALGLDFKITSKITGGGTNAQAEAMRLGLSRAIIKQNESLAPRLKSFGFLTHILFPH